LVVRCFPLRLMTYRSTAEITADERFGDGFGEEVTKDALFCLYMARATKTLTCLAQVPEGRRRKRSDFAYGP
jgi:hypothetical protein